MLGHGLRATAHILLASTGFQGQQITSQVAPYVSVNAPVVALTRVRLVDGTGATAREEQTVIVTGTQISAVGPTASTVVPTGAQVIDLTGHTLMPGLVQLHEHTYFGGVKQMTQMSTSGPLLYLAMGVTTAMSGGSQFPYPELNMKRMVDAGQIPGPRYHITGPYLNGGPPRSGNARILQSPEEARRVIAYWVSEGATWFKFQGTVSREILGAAILEAHRLGARVTGHLCSVTFTEAAALGIDLLQHGFITNSDYVASKKPDVCPAENMRAQADVDVSSDAVQQTIRQIVADKAAVASTLAVYETFIAERARLDPRAMEFLDPVIRKEVEQNHASIAKGGLTVPPRLLKKMMQWERDFVTAGGLLGSGSDPWGTGFLPGWGNLRNYELLVEAGFSPEQSIQIMTLNGAKILHEDAARGSIAVGKVADLVAVRGNPIAAPGDIYNVVTVFKDGIGYDSEKLRNAAKGKVGVN
jgi:hypothetical protein